MHFSTIIHDDLTYHGIVLEKRENSFIFAFRQGDRNFIWECNYDYWALIE